MTIAPLRITTYLLIAAAVIALAPPGAEANTSVVRVPLKGPAQVAQLLAHHIEILAFTRDGLDVVADEKQLRFLYSSGYPVTVLATSGAQRAASELGADLGMYHTYAEMESVLTYLAANYPAIANLSTIGISIEARNVYALKVSDNVAVDEDEAEILYMGCHHAREIMSVEIPLRFAKYLLENYGVLPEVTDYVNSREIFFVPMVNPDGHVYVENDHSGDWWTWWRKNRRLNADMSYGVDLNRNYGFEWGYDNVGSSPTPSSEIYRGTAAWSEPEVSTIRNFTESRDFTIWLSYHSYGESLLYPWGYIPAYTPDHNVFAALGDTLSESNGYAAGNFATGTIYGTNGDSDDWGYGEQAAKKKIFAFTPEINSSAEGGFGPPDTLITPTFNKLLRMNMLVLEYADNPYRVVGPYPPVLYSIQAPYYPVHTLRWSANLPADPNPVVYYEVERCKNPSFVTDEAESLSPDWEFDGFSLGGTAYTGSHGYYSGSGDNLSHAMTAKRPFLVSAQSDTFEFWANYDIETNWDYAYVDVSTDGGSTWTPVEGNITTDTNPYGNNRGHGITGSSAGWVYAVFPLTAWFGQEIAVRISYVTDMALIEHGIDVDVVYPVPTCGAVDIMASSLTDTLLQVIPDDIATYRYRVHAVDAESHVSGWSATQTIDITTLSAAGAPPSYASRLGQNYPNPFNPTTHIPYAVGGAAGKGAKQTVSLRIYSVRGQLVATLVDEMKTPGIYEAVWDGIRSDGVALASGVYFARLEVGAGEVFTRKIVLLK